MRTLPWKLGLVVLLTIVWGMTSVLNRIFFFLVDVVPAHGDNVQEAKAIALTGRYFELNKKFETEIENWTYEDTNELVSLANWRQRLFFPLKDRLRRLVPELQRIYYETGTQPGDLGGYKIAAIRESLPGGKISWFEKAIASTQAFNALVAFAIVAAVLTYLNPSHDSAQSLNKQMSPHLRVLSFGELKRLKHISWNEEYIASPAASHALPSEPVLEIEAKEIKDLYEQTSCSTQQKSRASRSNSGGGFGSFLGPGAGEVLAGGPC